MPLQTHPTTIGFVPANRGFFSSELAAKMRQQTIDAMTRLGINVVVPSPEQTKAGCVAAGFSDTPTDQWALYQILACVQAKIVAGYQPLMPTFQGLVSEEQLLTLIEYVKSLKTPEPRTPKK